MKFEEATLESAGCDEDIALHKFPQTANFEGKKNCPHNQMRCCIFCPERCDSRCEFSVLQRIRSVPEYNCTRLVSINQLAWKYILGTKAPNFK